MVTESFEFKVLENNYCGFYDLQGQYWTVSSKCSFFFSNCAQYLRRSADAISVCTSHWNGENRPDKVGLKPCAHGAKSQPRALRPSPLGREQMHC